jgi:hypothetical protein
VIKLATNAPASWPPVLLERPPREDEPSLFFAAAVETAFREGPVQVLEAGVIRLVYGGLLEVPLRVRDLTGEYDLFFYPRADARAAAHYRALLKLAGYSQRLRPIFYSVADLLSLPPGPPEVVVRRDSLSVRASLTPPGGDYAMWWAEEGEGSFLLSPTFTLYNRIYRELAGLEAWAFGTLLQEVGMARDPREFLELAGREVEIPLEGPEGIPLIASYTPRRGIRFHFHIRRTPLEYRVLFLDLFLHWVKLKKRRSPEPLDAAPTSPPLEWWKELESRIQAEEEPVEMVGAIHR